MKRVVCCSCKQITGKDCLCVASVVLYISAKYFLWAFYSSWSCWLCSELLRKEKANEVASCDNAQRSFDDFKIVFLVGKGTYGQVYKAMDTSTRQYSAYSLTHSIVRILNLYMLLNGHNHRDRCDLSSDLSTAVTWHRVVTGSNPWPVGCLM